MSGPTKSVLYALRPAYNIPENIDLPKNMYNLRKIQSSGEPIDDIVDAIQDKVKKILKSYSDVDVSLEKRWDTVLEQLAELKTQLADIRKSIEPTPSKEQRTVSKPVSSLPEKLEMLDGAVIRANPASPPYSLQLIRQLYKDEINITISSFKHSTLSLLPDLSSFSSQSTAKNGVPKLNLTLIWKDGLLDTELVVDPLRLSVILGEVNILRFLARLGLHSLKYNVDELSQLQIDSILELSHRLLHTRIAKEKQSIVRNLNSKLGRNLYYGIDNINISDIAVWSALKQTNFWNSADLTRNMKKWYDRIESSQS